MTTPDVTLESVVRGRTNIPAEEQARELLRSDDSHGDPDDPAAVLEGVFEAAPEWRVAKCLLALRSQVNLLAPTRDKSSDGTIGDERHCGGAHASDHCPNIRDGETGIVTAMDITNDKAHGCDAEAIAAAIRASNDPRVKYIIWNRRIANSSPVAGKPAWEWRPYTGSNPHDKHVHISVKPIKDGPSGYDTTTVWTITQAAPPVA